MDHVTRALVRAMEESEATPAQWIAWHTQRLGELAADPVARLELEHALRENAALLESAQSALDAVGEVVAEAACRRQETIERLDRALGLMPRAPEA